MARRARPPDGAELVSPVVAAFLNRCSHEDIERWISEGKLRLYSIRRGDFVDLTEVDTLMRGAQPVCGCVRKVK